MSTTLSTKLDYCQRVIINLNDLCTSLLYEYRTITVVTRVRFMIDLLSVFKSTSAMNARGLLCYLCARQPLIESYGRMVPTGTKFANSKQCVQDELLEWSPSF